jgi:hypothetical protein
MDVARAAVARVRAKIGIILRRDTTLGLLMPSCRRRAAAETLIACTRRCPSHKRVSAKAAILVSVKDEGENGIAWLKPVNTHAIKAARKALRTHRGQLPRLSQSNTPSRWINAGQTLDVRIGATCSIVDFGNSQVPQLE